MQAVVMTDTGGPEVLELRELPEPRIERPTQVKVRLKAAGINPIDTKLRSRGLFFPDALPAVIGCDGAGVVEEVGSEVSELAPGDAVWFCNGGLGREPGNYAEFAVVEAAVARRKPAQLSFVEAAAGPLVLITAWEALFDRARLKAGQHVLVHAGAGGVGHVAIQLAAHAGARVAATVGSPRKADFVKELGAERAIDYHHEDFVAAVEAWTAGRGADVVFDTVGPEVFARSILATAHYGDLVTLLDPGAVDLKEARLRNLRIGFTLMLTPMLRELPRARVHHGEILDRCAQLIDAGLLRVHVEHRLPLALAAEAHRLIETGHTQGKIVLTMD